MYDIPHVHSVVSIRARPAFIHALCGGNPLR
jgi:hypothetical protein